MFRNLSRTLNRLDGKKMSVAIPTDAEGFFDRECPSEICKFEFKIHEDDWANIVRDEEVFCPFCRNSEPADQWLTDAQVKHVEQAVLGQVGQEINSAMDRDAREWNRQQPRNSFLRITMSVKNKPRHIMLPAAVAEPMQLKIECSECACRYAVIGAAYFCPSCGHNSVENDFWRSMETQGESLGAIEHVRAAIEDRDVAENMVRTIVENGLLTAVTSFQRFAEALYRRSSDAAEPRKNAFQSLATGSELWSQVFGKQYVDYIGEQNLLELNRFFQQRHILSHKDGIVDEEYIRQSGDSQYELGQRIVVKVVDVRKCLSLVGDLARSLESESAD